jgi:hypothetical protein
LAQDIEFPLYVTPLTQTVESQTPPYTTGYIYDEDDAVILMQLVGAKYVNHLVGKFPCTKPQALYGAPVPFKLAVSNGVIVITADGIAWAV